MCSGAILLYKIPRVVIGENVNYKGEEDLLRSRGVEVVVLDDEKCKALMAQYIQEKPEVASSNPIMVSLSLTDIYTGLVRGHRRGRGLVHADLLRERWEQ